MEVDLATMSVEVYMLFVTIWLIITLYGVTLAPRILLYFRKLSQNAHK